MPEREYDEGTARGLVDPVRAKIEHAARTELMPRFADVARLEVTEKSPGEAVTDADLACEAALRSGLRDVLPEATFVGEESAHADPSLLETLAAQRWAWVVDPLDGTKHFAAGEDSFGIQVALLAHGQTVAAWIHLPLAELTAHAVRGGPAYLAGRRVRVPPGPEVESMQGARLTRFLPEALRARVEAVDSSGPRHKCSARQYVELLQGVEHYSLYYRTLPWDHAPGCLLIECAGGAARRFDGGAYSPADGGEGLLVSGHATAWSAVRARLLS